MARERLYLFDTTLRDGAQTTGVDFSLEDKRLIAKTLDEFLVNPTTKVPGTMMLIPVPDAKTRADIIAYLATLK